MRKKIFREGRCDYNNAKKEQLTYERPIGDKEEKKDDWREDRDFLKWMYQI